MVSGIKDLTGPDCWLDVVEGNYLGLYLSCYHMFHLSVLFFVHFSLGTV